MQKKSHRGDSKKGPWPEVSETINFTMVKICMPIERLKRKSAKNIVSKPEKRAKILPSFEK